MAGTPIAEAWATSNQAPLWVSVALYAVANADGQGHAVLRPGQLRSALNVSGPRVSDAIRRAVQAGWLASDSTAYCLVVRRGT